MLAGSLNSQYSIMDPTHIVGRGMLVDTPCMSLNRADYSSIGNSDTQWHNLGSFGLIKDLLYIAVVATPQHIPDSSNHIAGLLCIAAVNKQLHILGKKGWIEGWRHIHQQHNSMTVMGSSPVGRSILPTI